MFARLKDGEPIKWLQPAQKAPGLADSISPIHWARRGRPPTISVHAMADPEIPHSQAVRLHKGLRAAKVPNELVTLQSRGHLTPQHPRSEVTRAYERVFSFLSRFGVLTRESPVKH